MPAFINLIGKTFGRLVVISRAENRRIGKAQKAATFWLCKCSCGKVKEINGGGLRSGAVLSCGCLNSDTISVVGKARLIDISGAIFGKLKVLKRACNRGTKIYWTVQCSCGSKPYEVESLKLRNNRKQCPECSRLESMNDLTGKVFGKWRVLKKRNSVKGKVQWLAQCSCGSKPVWRRGDYFTNKGSAKDCGCEHIKSKLDIIGKTYNRLTVKKWIEGSMYLCKCECGNLCEIRKAHIISGMAKSCGCFRTEELLKRGLGSRGFAGMVGEDNPKFIGGPMFGGYDTYSVAFKGIERTRRDMLNRKAIQVRCSVCKDWFTPTKTQCVNRKKAINSIPSVSNYYEAKFYCSDECKQKCTSYGQTKYPKGFQPTDERREIVDPEIRDIALDRDDYQCQKCGSQDDLEVHHIEGVMQSPMVANDVDNCITVCQDCHKEIHAQPGCTYVDYRRDSCEDIKEAVNM